MEDGRPWRAGVSDETNRQVSAGRHVRGREVAVSGHDAPASPVGRVNCTVRPGPHVGGGPQPATVGLDDRAADHQPQDHAFWLGRVEGGKDPIQVLRVKPDAGVLDGDVDSNDVELGLLLV